MTNRCTTSSITNPCPIYVNTLCVRYTGANLTNIGVTTNSSLTTILQAINNSITNITADVYIQAGPGVTVTGEGGEFNPYIISSFVTSTPNLQEVTDVGNDTTNSIIAQSFLINTSSSNYFGTTDTTPFQIVVNNQSAGYINYAQITSDSPYTDSGPVNIGLVALGPRAGQALKLLSAANSSSIAIGPDALQNNTVDENIATGQSTMKEARTMYSSTVVGNNSVAFSWGGNDISAFGHASQEVSSGASYNTSGGSNSLRGNKMGGNIVAIGSFSLWRNTTSVEDAIVTAGGTGYTFANVVISAPEPATPGTLSVQATGTASVSGGAVVDIIITERGEGYSSEKTPVTITITGDGSGATATAVLRSGDYLVAIGANSLLQSKTSKRLVAIGFESGVGTGSNQASDRDEDCVFLGYRASRDGSLPNTTALSNSAAIGANAKVATNNSIVLGAIGSRVGIGTISPAITAVLDLTSTTQGMLTPRLTTVQRDAISSPATGLFIYNTTNIVHEYWDGTQWISYNNLPNTFANPMTTLGDIITGAALGAPQRLGAGTENDVLTIVSGVPTWAAITGSLTSFSAGTLSPLFTTSVTNPTTTPALSFALTNAGANTYFGNATGSTAAPSYTAAGALTRTDDTNVTLTLGGNASTALLRAASLTLGWTGTLAISRGGTGLSSLGSANQLLRVNAGASALEYFTPDYISNITGLVQQGTLISITGTGTSIDPYIVNSAAGSVVSDDFNASTDWTGPSGGYYELEFVHNLDDDDLIVTVWDDTSGRIQVFPEIIEQTDSNTLTLRVPSSPDERFVGSVIVSSASLPSPVDADFSDHDNLSNLTWGISGHLGTPSRIASFDGAGAASYSQIGVDVQAYTATLNALSTFNTNGFVVQTATATFEGRTILGQSNRISITDGSGVGGNPIVDISASYIGQTSITTLGTITSGTWNANIIPVAYGGTGQSSYTNGQLLIGNTTGNTLTKASLTAPAAGISITGGAGSITFALTDDLSALEALSSSGIAVRTGTSTWTVRTITGTSNQVSVSNGDGVSGNPTLSLPQNIHTAATPQFAGLGIGTSGASGVVNLAGTSSLTGYLGGVDTKAGTTYTLLAADTGRIITFTSASPITLTVPAGLAIGFNVTIIQLGSGVVTVAGSGTTVNNRSAHSKTAGQYAVITLASYNTNVFALAGDSST